MSEKILTIIVPTYNRKETLARGVEAIIPQVIKYKDKVALYISDNCSDDGTDEYIQSLHAKHPGLFESKRQAKNLGAQLNFQDAVRSVKTKYAVIFSDDDFMFPNFVATILFELAIHPEIGLIHYNCMEFCDDRYNGVFNWNMNDGVPKYYETGGDFIKEHTSRPSLVSSNIFNREVFAQYIDKVDFNEYPGYGWFAILMKSVITMPCVYIDMPLMAYHPDTSRFDDKIAWYLAYGLTKLFKELECDSPGLLNAWAKEFDRGMSAFCLSRIGKYRDQYKDRYKILMEYSVSPTFSKRLKYYVYCPRILRALILNYVPRIVRNLRKIVHA